MEAKDVAECFVHRIERADKLTRSPYKAAMESANMSRGEEVLCRPKSA